VKLRAIIVLFLAAICGISAATGINRLRNSSQAKTAEAKHETVPVVVAAVQIPRGHMVQAEDLKICRWPKEAPMEGALAEVEEAVDRAALVPVIPGEPVLNAKLASKDAGRGLAPLIPKGMRAYTIQTSRVASNVAGFILPGNRVDVLLNLKGARDDKTGGGSTTTLLQSVEILAVDQQLDAPAENKVDPDKLGSVTLLVTPKQAALLDLGQNMGRLTLSLRNPEDDQEARTRPAILADIRFRQEKPVEKPQADQAESAPIATEERRPEGLPIIMLRGSQRAEVLVSSNR